MKQIDKGHKKEDLYPTIGFFHRNMPRFEKKDIAAYKDLKELEDATKDLSLAKSAS